MYFCQVVRPFTMWRIIVHLFISFPLHCDAWTGGQELRMVDRVKTSWLAGLLFDCACAHCL